MNKKIDYKNINSKVFDRWVEEGWQWGIPIISEIFEKARKGEWEVLLTPTKAVPRNWFGDLKGKKLLGLASGGGQQIPIFTAAGAMCTVLDYSDKQLESEKQVAQREGYDVEIVKADMTKPLPFEDESFDIIFHPVSNDYIDEIEIGSQLNAGFILTHIEDDTNGEGRLHELNIPTYMMTRAIKE